MIDKIIRGVIGVVGLLFGYGIVAALNAPRNSKLITQRMVRFSSSFRYKYYFWNYIFLIGPPKGYERWQKADSFC